MHIGDAYVSVEKSQLLREMLSELALFSLVDVSDLGKKKRLNLY
jgi:hypothetical protein